jgi:hypothetical protein
VCKDTKVFTIKQKRTGKFYDESLSSLQVKWQGQALGRAKPAKNLGA